MSGTTRNRRDADRGKWAVAISALLTEPTHAAAAKKAGIGEATLRRWMRSPAFVALYRAARRQVIDAAVGRLVTLATSAVDTVQRQLQCGHPGVELRAAGMVLDTLKEVALEDVVARLEALEAESRIVKGPAE